MAGIPYTSSSQPVADRVLSGGLNSTSGPLNVANEESSDLQNVDFNKFGSVLKRNGYVSAGTCGTKRIDGLHWYEFASGGTSGRMAIAVAGSKFYTNQALAGVWTDVTGAVSIASSYHCDFENYVNKVFVTNGTNTPFWFSAEATTCGAMTVPTGVVRAKYIRQFNNYLFLGNVAIGATDMSSRIYYSGLKDPDTWDSDKFIEISKDDGQQITGLKALSDRLVIFKERSIYNLYFTGDADFEFNLPGGGKSNSAVGCIAPWSIQEVDNGLVFLSYDGLYYYDGLNSYKLSEKVATTLGVDTSPSTATVVFNPTYFANAVSCVQKSKNRYFLGLTESLPNSSTTNNGVLVWDYFNNAMSVYTGMNPSAMATFYVNGVDERPSFGDYNGYTYRMDSGTDDYPLNVQTAINSFFKTNWKHFDDLVDQKGIAHVYLYYQINSGTLTISYAYDFENADSYSSTINMGTGLDVFGSGVYGTATYASTGGRCTRRDLTGRGRVVRLNISNSNLSETFRIDGIGSMVHLETNV